MMDKYTSKSVIVDGHCLFISLSLVIDFNIDHCSLRNEAVKYVCNHWKYFKDYIVNVTKKSYHYKWSLWGKVEIFAISELFRVNVNVYRLHNGQIVKPLLVLHG